MNFSSSSSRQQVLVPNVLPLIDILLVLVSFLLLTWQAVAPAEQDTKVQLPTSGENLRKSRTQSRVVLNISRDGAVSVNSRKVEQEELSSLLKRLGELEGEPAVILRVDKDAPYDRVLPILDLCQNSGVAAIGFAALAKVPAGR